MSSKISKGQRIKTFTAWIPQSDLTRIKTTVVVYFNARNGDFTIYDGAHMLDTVREVKTYDSRQLGIGHDRITCATLNEIVKGFEDICGSYERAMREAAKSKVIRFTFKTNRAWTEDRQALSQISFCGTPAVHFTYEVLYRVGNLLYWKDDDAKNSNLQYRGRVDEARFRDGDAITVEWTEEREAFFANMQASLVTLINRVDDFQKNLLENVDKAIAMSSPLMLEHKQ